MPRPIGSCPGVAEARRREWAEGSRQPNMASFQKAIEANAATRTKFAAEAIRQSSELIGATSVHCRCGAPFFPARGEKLDLCCNCRALRVEVIIAERGRLAAA